MLSVGLLATRRAARPAAQIAGHTVAFAGVLVAMLAMLGGCSAGPSRVYEQADGAAVMHDGGAVSIEKESASWGDSGAGDATSEPAPHDAGAVPPVDVVSDAHASGARTDAATVQQSTTAASSSNGSSGTTAPATCDPLSDECGAQYCTPDGAECITRTDTRGEGTPCETHAQCANGHACGYIGDPQWRELACLRLGYSDADCGGALGRIKFDVGLTPLADANGTQMGLCIGDIR